MLIILIINPITNITKNMTKKFVIKTFFLYYNINEQ